MSKEIMDYGFGVIETRETFYPEDVIRQKDQRIAELEAKLAESEKAKESYRLQNEDHHLKLLQFYSRLGVEAFGADIHEKALETLMIMKEQLAEKKKKRSPNMFLNPRHSENIHLREENERLAKELEKAKKSPIPKFKTVGALAAAYLELEKEFSRKAQLLKQKSLKYASLEITKIEFYDNIILISWQCNLGFGQCELIYNQHTNEWTVNSECMSEEFVNALIRKMFEKVKVI